jgi:acetyl-CoA carboxylase biotin carboxyl carrier protein
MNKPELSHEDVTRILRLIDGLPDGEMTLEMADMKLHVRKGAGEAAPDRATAANVMDMPPRAEPSGAAVTALPVDTPPVAAASPAAPETDPGLATIRAPMLGRFYRAASPNEPAFVEVGTLVDPEDTVCLIEVMKLFNTVKAGIRGTIVEIKPANQAMVEYDEVLFTIRLANG